MRTISIKELRPIRMTAKTLVFEDANHGTYMATRRVANDILGGAVDEVLIMDFPPSHRDYCSHLPMLATPSCW